MLTAGQSSTVSFSVNVMGTSADPSVRVILAAHPELSFPAVKDGEKWTTHLAIPAALAPGDYDLRVEVTLNSRLFTPIRKKVNVAAAAQSNEPMPAVEPKVEATATVAPNPIVAKPTTQVIAPKNSLFAQVTQAKQHPVAPSISYPKLRSFESINSDIIAAEPIEIAEAPALTGLATLVERGPRKIYPPIHTPLPRKSQVSEAPITVRISEIDSITAHTSVRVLEATPVIRTQKSIHNSTLVKLVKEDVFYE